jgi:hypothetical protein
MDINSTDWTIDYRFATITMEDGKMIVTLPTNTSNPELSALNLKSGGTYQFRFEGIADVAASPNMMGNMDLEPAFTTVYAQVNMSRSDADELAMTAADGSTYTIDPDISFRLTPVSTSKVPDSDCYDILLWSDTDVKFDVYRRVVDTEHEAGSADCKSEDWAYLGTHGAEIKPNPEVTVGYSITHNLLDSDEFEPVKTLYEYCNYEYAIYFTEVGGSTNRDGWDAEITNKVTIAAANKADLKRLTSRSVTPSTWEEADYFTSIGLTYNGGVSSDELILTTKFTDRLAPKFEGSYPMITPTSTTATVTVLLDRPATIFYVATPLSDGVPRVNTETADGVKITGSTTTTTGNDNDYATSPSTYVPTSGGDQKSNDRSNPLPVLSRPTAYSIKYAKSDGINVSGSVSYADSMSALSFDITGLTPETDYYVFFLLQGESSEASYPEVYKFTTTSIDTPAITLLNHSPEVEIGASSDADITYALIATAKMDSTILNQPFWANSTLAEVYGSGNDTTGVITSPDMKVIDAIEQVKDHNLELSYFDMYASPALKEKVLEYITATKVNDDARRLQATTSVTPSKPSTVDLTKDMSYDTDYYLVAVGKHPSLKASDIKTGDTIANHYGFKAVEIKRVDTTAPQLTSVSPLALQGYLDGTGPVALNSNTTTDWETTPLKYKYSGTITLTYDKPLYYNDNGNLKTVVMKANLTDAEKQTMISAQDLIGGAARAKIQVDPTKTSTSPTQEFTFKITDITDADLFIFPNSGKVVGSSSGDAAAVTTLIFDPTLQASSYKGGYGDRYRPGFTLVTSSSNT